MKIFLSHASESKPRVRRIAEMLPRHVDAWLDQDELAAGRKFPDIIERAIRLQSDFTVVFVDAQALDSEWVRREVDLALRREVDLQRPFVIPVLLGDVAQRLHELGFDPGQRLYLDARDLSDEGLARSGRALADELFKLASRLIESLRSVDRRALLDAFSSELTAFQQAAYRFVSTFENSLESIVLDERITALVRDALADYNAVADRFIARLPQHRDRLTAAWRDRRALCNDVRELATLIEVDVYRGALFAFSDVIEVIHAVNDRADVATVRPHEPRREAVVTAARRALERLSTKASDVISDLEAELET